jgi:hypothetical protein
MKLKKFRLFRNNISIFIYIMSTNLNPKIKQFGSVNDIVEALSSKDCCDLIKLIKAMHRGFDKIITSRAAATTFRGRSQRGFAYGLTLYRILKELTSVTAGKNGMNVNIMKVICFGTFTRTSTGVGTKDMDADDEGLLLWYCENGQKPKLCQIINPYDIDGRRAQAVALTKWDNWRTLDKGALHHYLRWQQKRDVEARSKARENTKKNPSEPVSLIAMKLLGLCQKAPKDSGCEHIRLQDITDEFIRLLMLKRTSGFKRYCATNIPILKDGEAEALHSYLKKGITRGSRVNYPLKGKITNYLGLPDGNIEPLDPLANKWMLPPGGDDGGQEPNTEWSRMDADDDEMLLNPVTPLKIQILTPNPDNTLGSSDDYEFSAVGNEITLDSEEKLNNCVLIPTESGVTNLIDGTGYNHINFLQSGLERNLIDIGKGIEDEAMNNWKPIFQTYLRDSYNKLGNPEYQNRVPFLQWDGDDAKTEAEASGTNPTPGRTGKGLMCAICSCKTPGGKKKEWAAADQLNTDNQTWDVDHIANLIFNELFKLNETSTKEEDLLGDGRGFLDTCGTCNRQFKGEKLWSPSWDLWNALIIRCNTPTITHTTYRWPGIDAPGIVEGAKPPYDGYRVYMTKAYQTASSQGKAKAILSGTNFVKLKKTISQALGHGLVEHKGKGKKPVVTAQASGVKFINRQDQSKNAKTYDKAGCIPDVRLEAIILNRFLLIARDNRDDSLAASVLNSANLLEAAVAIEAAYNAEIELFPALASLANTVRSNQSSTFSVESASQDMRNLAYEKASKYASDEEESSSSSDSNDDLFPVVHETGASAVSSSVQYPFSSSTFNPSSSSAAAIDDDRFSPVYNTGSTSSSAMTSPGPKPPQGVFTGTVKFRTSPLTTPTKSSGLPANDSPLKSVSAVKGQVYGDHLTRNTARDQARWRQSRPKTGWSASPAIVRYPGPQKGPLIKESFLKFLRLLDENKVTREQRGELVDNIARDITWSQWSQQHQQLVEEAKIKTKLVGSLKKQLKKYDDKTRKKSGSSPPRKRSQKELDKTVIELRGINAIIRFSNSIADAAGALKRMGFRRSSFSSSGSGSSYRALYGTKGKRGKRGRDDGAGGLKGASTSSTGSTGSQDSKRGRGDWCKLPADNFEKLSGPILMSGNTLAMRIYILRLAFLNGDFDDDILEPQAPLTIDNTYSCYNYIQSNHANDMTRKIWACMSDTVELANGAQSNQKNANPLSTENVRVGGLPTYHWRIYDILAALKHYCPKGAWTIQRTSIISGDGSVEIEWVQKEGGFTTHWNVLSMGISVENIFGYPHPNGGDCGPSAVLIAITHFNLNQSSRGGKRTRKKRRNKKKTKRRRKYRKKTKGRKRRRKKRTRRK